MQRHSAIEHSKNIRKLLNYISYDTSVVLFDLDNTVIRPHGYLGSDQWFMRLFEYACQAIDTSKSDTALVLAIYYEMQRHLSMKAVESIVIPLIARLHDIGYPIIAITSRSQEIEKATRAQLSAIGIDFDEMIFCAGQSKGVALELHLKGMKEPWKKVLMIDDKAKHLEEVDTSLSSCNINFQGMRYSRMDREFIKEDSCQSVAQSLQSFNFFSPQLQSEVDAMLQRKNQVNKAFS